MELSSLVHLLYFPCFLCFLPHCPLFKASFFEIMEFNSIRSFGLKINIINYQIILNI